MIKSLIQLIAAPADIFNKGTDTSPNPGQDVRTTIGDITSVAMYVIGIISVIMIIAGGIMYATSNGDEQKVARAKKFIIGAIVGLVVAVLATAATIFLKGGIT
jgi:hypothetical protein